MADQKIHSSVFQASLSKKKQDFLQHVSLPSYPMTLKNMLAIQKKYNDKYKINIRLSGETVFGQEIIAAKTKAIKDEIVIFSDKNKKYAHYVKKFWNCRGKEGIRNVDNSDFRHLAEEFEAEYSTKFLDDQNKIKHNLSRSEEAELNKVAQHIADRYIIPFDKYIEIHQSELERQTINYRLNADEQTKEINDLQKHLKQFNSEDTYGYLCISTHPCQGFIIKKNCIINVVNNIHDYPFSSVVGNVVNMVLPRKWANNRYLGFPCPFQAEDNSFFLMLYFKELLKDKQKQLRDYTLLIPYFGASDKNSTPLEYFLFPSPQILRYSQEEYSDAIKAMLLKGETTYRGEPDTVKTISAILDETKAKAIEQKNTELVEEVAALQNRLEDFSQVWLSEYEKTKAKCLSMSVNNENQYPAYKAMRLGALSQ